MQSETPHVMAYVCDRESRIKSLAVRAGLSAELSEGHLLLDAIRLVGAGTDLQQLWLEMINGAVSIQGEADVLLNCKGPPLRMLFHAMPLHKGMDEGMFLVTLCSGFQVITAGPDEVARSRAVLETAVDSIVTINSTGIICSFNPAVVKMFGYQESELIGRNVSMLMPEPYKREHDSYMSRYLETRIPSIIGIGRQVVGRKKNGREFPAHLAVSEFTVRGVQFFTGVIRDLSELERVQKQLLQAERLAAIGQMVTGLAHESRNALQRAQACLDMLSLDLQNSPEQLDLARRATTALQDLHRLYEEVRSYAAPIHLEYRPCELSTIWKKEWENLATVRRDRKIQLIEVEGNQTISCEVDVHRMEQVFRNILENAIHACGETGVITIRSSITEWQGEPAGRIAVQDDGAGMTPEIAQQVFEPFFTTKQKGTGLGMAIVNRIMTAHAGFVSAGILTPKGAEIVLIVPLRMPIRNAVRS
jgi:two-component system sensor kinase FixL